LQLHIVVLFTAHGKGFAANKSIIAHVPLYATLVIYQPVIISTV